MSEKRTDTAGMVIRIGHLYPTLMSVAADRGNLFSIERRCNGAASQPRLSRFL
ncbi:hypothetical protein [Dictyobacter halimunensis]|uniref:hypothetical protein n=1 Tax=Dictyobacter halimunensis TaxID=3026934 RepID=UPI0030C6DD3A